MVRLSSRPIKSDVSSDVPITGIEARRVMVQLPTLELSINLWFDFRVVPLNQMFQLSVSKPDKI